MSINPYSAPVSDPLPKVIPLDPAIQLQGAHTAEGLAAALRLYQGNSLVVRIVLLVFMGIGLLQVLAVVLQWFNIRSRWVALSLAAALGIFWLWMLARWLRGWLRIRAVQGAGGALRKPLRGVVTSEGIELGPAEPGAILQLYAWSDGLQARIGDRAAAVIFRSGTQAGANANRTLRPMVLLSPDITASEEDWQRLRRYLAQHFPPPPIVALDGMAACHRCQKRMSVDKLRPVAAWLRWCWPPYVLGPLLGGQQSRFCRPCRRSLSFALFFVVFMLLMVLLMFAIDAFLPAPHALPRG